VARREREIGLISYTSLNGYERGRECPITQREDVRLGNAERVRRFYSAVEPFVGGDTPTADAIDLAVSTLASAESGTARYVLLLTDGVPDTCAEPDPGAEAPLYASTRPRELAAQLEGVFGEVRSCSVELGTDVDAGRVRQGLDRARGGAALLAPNRVWRILAGMRISCSEPSDVPDRAFFEREVTREQYVVLAFPEGRPWSAIEPIGQGLAQLLPDYSVFQSGANTLTVMYLLPEAHILPMASELVAAAARFRELAVQLVGSLERHLGVDTAGLLDPWLRGSERGSGELGGWDYSLHGRQCLFVHLSTGQSVDVHLHAGDPGVLDPYFFHQFMASTPELAHLAAALPEAFHDTRRAISVLAQHGHLAFHEGEAAGGWVAR
jgi:hypothetical protein